MRHVTCIVHQHIVHLSLGLFPLKFTHVLQISFLSIDDADETFVPQVAFSQGLVILSRLCLPTYVHGCNGLEHTRCVRKPLLRRREVLLVVVCSLCAGSINVAGAGSSALSRPIARFRGGCFRCSGLLWPMTDVGCGVSSAIEWRPVLPHVKHVLTF